MKITSKNIIKYIIIGVILYLLVFLNKKPLEADNTKDMMRYFSDCGIVPGVVLVLLNALAWVGNQGMFDGIGYASRYIGAMFIPNLNIGKGKDGFYKYKISKEEKRSKGVNIDALVVGLGFIIIGMIFYILYYVN